MKTSWSQQLFLKINSFSQKYSLLDWLIFFCASLMIFILGAGIILWGIIYLAPVDFKTFVKLLLTAMTTGIVFSWFLAIVWPHHRPKVELSGVKTIVGVYQNWKAFPSDHTMLSFILVFVAWFSGMNFWLVVPAFLIACLVGVGRVFGGVHYPRDIIGGFIFAIIFSSLSFWLLGNVTQPLYSFFINLF